MMWGKETLLARLSALPMLAMLIVTILAIYISSRVHFPLWLLVVGFVGLVIAVWFLQGSRYGDLYLCGAAFFLVSLSVELHRPSDYSSRSALYEIEVERLTAQTTKYSRGEGVVNGLYRNNRLYPCHIPIGIYADSTLHLVAGEHLVAQCRIVSFSPFDENPYRRYMARRGVVGAVWLGVEDVVCSDTLDVGVVGSLRQRAMGHLSLLELSTPTEALVGALTLGQREGLTTAMKESFRRSGASHLLAVSGLHIGFVYILVGALLLVVLLLPFGQLWRSVLLVAVIWLYVAIVGFSPSVVRAAVMFSLLQLLVALSSSSLSLNGVAGAAMLILWFSPQMLWDIGFVLSCVAVAAIVAWGVPLNGYVARIINRRFDTAHSLLRGVAARVVLWVVSAFIVSGVASVATMPLVAAYFGLCSLWGVVLGPLMVLLCGLTVGVALLWIILPITPLAPLFGGVVEWLGSTMCALAEWCAEREALIFEGAIPMGLCVAIYIVYVVATLVWWARR